MKLLQLAPPWFAVPPERYGGIELVVAALTDGLVAAGHEVTLLAAPGSRTRGRLWSVLDRAPSEDLGDPFVELPHVIAGYRARHAFDLIHDHTVLGAAQAALLDGPPVVHTVHGAFTTSLARLYREISDRVHLVALSLDHALRAPHDARIAGVVPNGLDLSRYPVRARGSGYLAFLGRAGADKGADLALQVAERLERPLHLGIKVNETEEHRWWEQVLRPRLERATVPTRVVLDATHDEKVALLGGADVLLFPIRWDEPFGLVMAEANAVGTPVVAFARGAVPEVVADGVTGILVPPGDVDGLCAAVAAAERLDRRACRRWVADRFGADRMVADYEDLYRRVLDGADAPLVAEGPPRAPEARP